jgi:hypothetical protein
VDRQRDTLGAVMFIDVVDHQPQRRRCQVTDDDVEMVR